MHSSPAIMEAGPEEQLALEHSRLRWILSSQRAAELYESGAKLWNKRDLQDIEQQLSSCRTAESFTVRRVDGAIVRVSNPMYGKTEPIWKPQVQFQEYWRLVRVEPEQAPATYNCTYLVDWENHAYKQFETSLHGYETAFDLQRLLWNDSVTCQSFKTQIRKLLGTRKVNKVVCFGLGDLTARPPCWSRIQNKAAETSEPEMGFVEGGMMQHWAAFTLADVIRRETGSAVRLLTQDPRYTVQTREMLTQRGFEIVGQHGAGGFAEVDDETAVFSAFPQAPVVQVIADIARPALYITFRSDENLDENWKPSADPQSPRTRMMWRDYEDSSFPTAPEEVPIMGRMDRLTIFAKKAEHLV